MIDRYTKAVSTVIATALVAQNSMRPVAAAYNDACGFVGHPAREVTWTLPLPVKI
jgi:hypothetical protein